MGFRIYQKKFSISNFIKVWYICTDGRTNSAVWNNVWQGCQHAKYDLLACCVGNLRLVSWRLWERKCLFVAESLLRSQWKNSSYFMKSQDLLLCSLTIVLSVVKSVCILPSYIFKILSDHIFQFSLGFPGGLFPSCFPIKPCMQLLHAFHILFSISIQFGHLPAVTKLFCALNFYVVLTALKHRTGER